MNAINDLGSRYLEINRFSGIIVVAKESAVIYQNEFGLANYEISKSFSDKTAFKIGEISELITAEIIRSMEQEGKLQLSDKVSKYIPEIKADFTINNLLSHNAGLPSIQVIRDNYPSLSYSTIEYVNLGIKSSGKPKRSDLGYNVLGHLIEKISGRSFQKNMEDLCAKLALENTYLYKKDTALATGYLYHNFRGKGLELQRSPTYDLEIAFSSNGLKASANDLVKVINSNLQKKIEIEGYLANDGFSYSIVNNPEAKLSIIVLSNRRHPVAKEISNSINSILTAKNYKLPLLREPVSIDKTLLKEYSGTYSLNENMNFEVSIDMDSLFVTLGPNIIQLIPQSSNQFFMEHHDAALRFLRDESNNVFAVELLDGFLEGQKAK
ncbi:serine hydrolase, partial [Xanthovirga aplysinae]|uniref:serine hydrolase n=1 Tax=Xanthovirga aplysinae TaxID=2529853 RepID=UPI001CA40ED5